jgi:hypothetical protein
MVIRPKKKLFIGKIAYIAYRKNGEAFVKVKSLSLHSFSLIAVYHHLLECEIHKYEDGEIISISVVPISLTLDLMEVI